MTECETALATLDEAHKALTPIWRDTRDDELFRALRAILFRIGQSQAEINKIMAAAAERA